MTFELSQFLPASAEIFLLIMSCIVLLSDVFVEKRHPGICYGLTQLTLIGAALITAWLWLNVARYTPVVTLSGMFVLDPLASLTKLLVYVTSSFAFLYARRYNEERQIPSGDYCILGLFAILGMIVTISAHSLLVLFMGLELLSLPIYAMVAMWRSSQDSSEAAMKYFVMGALASGMLLYGMSMLYGATKSLDISIIAHAVSNMASAQHSLILVFGLVFIVAGLAFKFGAAPFHLWAPDVYEGAPTSTVLFLGSAPKIAILVLAARLLIDAMPSLHVQWQQLLMFLAIVSIGLGNIVAIAQNNIKRMLAYSSIAHMGYMSLGLLSGTTIGYGAATFYMMAYMLMSMGAFGGLLLLSRKGFESNQIEDLRGLNTRNPWLAFMMLLILFSMAGIPPSVGFFAKLGVLQALVGIHMTWLAVLAIAFSVIGSYYYIRIVKVMYFDEPVDNTPIVNSADARLAISLNGLIVLGLGIFPGALMDICRQAFILH